MVLDALLALALVLTAASQLRPGDVPVGPGEICLIVWLTLAFARTVARDSLSVTPALSRMLTFWALFALAESVGTLVGYAMGDVHDPSEFIHDVMAYPLIAAFSCLSVVGSNAAACLDRVARLVLVLGAIFLTVQLPIAWHFVDLPLVQPWYWDRFRGWSNNPNQLALFCTTLVLLALHFADKSNRRAQWIGAIACAMSPLLVGRLTQTDTFLFALAAAAPFFLATKLWIWLTAPELRVTPRPGMAMMALVVGPLMLASFVPIALSTLAASDRAVVGLMKNGGKEATEEADLRLELWQEAIRRGLESGTLGLGPGPHLAIPWSIVLGRQTEQDPDPTHHPAANGMPNYEAHNTLFDLFVQGGLIAVGSLVWLVAAALVNAWKARLAGLSALLCGLIVFGMTNLIIRQPIFWFAIAICLTAERRQYPYAKRRLRTSLVIRRSETPALK
jgi:hypothetical protein